MLELVVIYFVGVLTGVILGKVLSRPNTIGTIRIDRSDADGPYMFLELDKPLHTFENDKHVCVEIKNVNFLPHN